MSRIAFSTVALPDWTLDRVAEFAARWGYEGVELRTQGFGNTIFACDPAGTDAAKIRRLFTDAGVEVASLATGLAFDAPIRPRVLGRVFGFGDQESAVRRAKRMIDLAAQLECPFVRVFAFEVPSGETLACTLDLIVDRLRAVADHAEKTGVRIALENGGSFSTSADLREVVTRVGSALVGTSYSGVAARAAGEDPVRGAAQLGDRLWLARVEDLRSGLPCPPGDGEESCAAFTAAAAGAAWAVFEWDRAWLPGLAPGETVLPEAAARLFAWSPRMRIAAGAGR